MARPVVILYSATLHAWEAWSGGRPVGHGSLESCQKAYPDAPAPSERQFRLERIDTEGKTS